MLYDLFISVLAIVGTLTVIVYSIRMAKSRVYAIGIIHKTTDSSLSASSPTIEEGQPAFAPAATDSKDRFFGHQKMWLCKTCGVVKRAESEIRCMRCKQSMTLLRSEDIIEVSDFETLSEESQSPAGISAINSKLQSHDRVLQEVELRLRKLESESVQKTLEASEESNEAVREQFVN